MGLSPWQSRFSLWHKKAGLPHPPFEPSSAAEWGVRLEDAVALKYAELHPEVNVSPAGTFRHRDREWQRATPDRLGSDRIVEVKTSPFGDGWEQGVPVHYRCQVIWQMDTLGYQRTDIALLVSGHEYREYTVEYDPVDAKILRHSAAQFLNSVKLGERPPIDESGHTYQTIRLQPAGRLDIDVPVPGELADRYAADRAALRRRRPAAHQHQVRTPRPDRRRLPRRNRGPPGCLPNGQGRRDDPRTPALHPEEDRRMTENTTSTAVAVRDSGPGALVAQHRPDIELVMPSHMQKRVGAWIRTTQGLLRRDPEAHGRREERPRVSSWSPCSTPPGRAWSPAPSSTT
jgi:putative phage-type endonuclease